jgi:hypothetical protein
MAKKITGIIKLQIPAGQANPAPPVGPALGQHGVNIMGFCKEFNAATKADAGLIIPVVIQIAAGVHSLEKSRRHHRRVQGAEQGKGRQGHAQTGLGHRENEIKGFKRYFGRSRVPDHRRHGAQHGNRGRRMNFITLHVFTFQ